MRIQLRTALLLCVLCSQIAPAWADDYADTIRAGAQAQAGSGGIRVP
jgi:hypothetical protein